MATNQGGGNKGDKQSNKQTGNRGASQGGNNQSDTSNRGFASMDPERQREIASEGGRAAHASGNAHEFTSEEAREAGKRSHGSGSQQSDAGSGNKQSDADNKGPSGSKSK
jgi:general stress protein YciG